MFFERLKRRQCRLATIVPQVLGHMRCIYNVEYSSIVGKKGSILESQSGKQFSVDSIPLLSIRLVVFYSSPNEPNSSARFTWQRKTSSQIIFAYKFASENSFDFFIR